MASLADARGLSFGVEDKDRWEHVCLCMSVHRVMSTAVSWFATPFSGMALPWPLWLTMDFCHLQKLSSDFPAWWVISRVGWSSVSRMRRVTRMLTMFPRLESWKSLAT